MHRSFRLRFARSCLLFSVLLVLAAAPAQATQNIKWQNLLPQTDAIKDPFAHLTQDQRFDIETIMWVRSLTDQEKQLEQNRQGVEDAKKYERQFKSAGIDLEVLLKKYQSWQAEVEKRKQLVNNKLDGNKVRLAGYLLPLEFSEKGERDFLLVPYVGACIHVPPPPPNQIVLVRLKDKMVVRDLYTPVWISGQMKTKRSSRALTLVDGTANVTVGYHIDGAEAEIYREN